MKIHLRIGLQNTGALCGAEATEMSQSLLGVKVQGFQAERQPEKIHRPCRGDYCDACLGIYEASRPAISALCHLSDGLFDDQAAQAAGGE